MNKQCPTCPFYEANRGKPTPTGFKCEDIEQADWYSQENIDGIWNVTRNEPVVFLSCHTTDPDYYGKEGKPIYACVGAVLAVYMHIKIMEDVKNYHKYVAIVGKGVAMKQRVMAEKALAIILGKTSPLWGGMLIAKEFHLDLDAMRWPTGFEKTIAYFKTLINDGQQHKQAS